ncbi:histidine kinase [Streptomyces sp. NPDC051907]|uniref:sensor histidine kinase n=1 Tax=Streptomyces sp. NPDC051907 TaxID=3155284 RepID=UPI003428DE73
MRNQARAWLGAIALCGVMLGFPALVEGIAPTGPEAGAAALSCAPLPLCRRWTLPALFASLAAVVWSIYLTALVFPPALPILVCLYVVGLTKTMRTTVLTAGSCVAVVLVTVQAVRHVPEFDLRNGTQLGWFVAAPAIGVAVTNQRRFRAEAAESREAEARRRVGEERLHIAQELHDIVGHSIAMINVQANVAVHVIDRQPEQVRESLMLIRDASGTALEEIRATLGLLRQADPNALPVSPVSGLGDIDALVERARAAGLEVDYEVSGERREVPAVVGATAYRLVQEALTNVVKHAGRGSQVQVLLGFGERRLTVVVTDDGGGTAEWVPLGTGLGLSGMRERVTAAGGTLEAGPLRSGFRVAAEIPTEAS